MADIVSRQIRSAMMSGIRAKNTQPEITVRRYLHRRGFRYRLHDRSLPGAPDLVLPQYRAVIFVHGCFWHRHERCKDSVLPSSNREFWQLKLNGNKHRDRIAIEALLSAGWRVAVVWECSIRRIPEPRVLVNVERWLRGRRKQLELRRKEA
jgi:DNA mismatch endonuclease, patch repair protein